jgi:regulatory protein
MRAVTTDPIERVEPDPRREGAVRLVVGGRPVLTVPVEAARAERVGPGVVLDDAAWARLGDWADREAAFRTALRLLGRRPFARRDLGRRLTQKGHAPPAVAAALDRAAAAGVLDDERFARDYVQTRSARGRGPGRIRRELLAQGVPDAVVERTLAAETSEEQSRAMVVALARRRARQLRDLEAPVRLRRVVAFLARRGYAGAEVRRLVRETI